MGRHPGLSYGLQDASTRKLIGGTCMQAITPRWFCASRTLATKILIRRRNEVMLLARPAEAGATESIPIVNSNSVILEEGRLALLSQVYGRLACLTASLAPNSMTTRSLMIAKMACLKTFFWLISLQGECDLPGRQLSIILVVPRLQQSRAKPRNHSR